MSDKKEKSVLDYDFETFKQQMIEATELLKEMNGAATYMRWQYNMEQELSAFQKEVDIASGWINSWCG